MSFLQASDVASAIKVGFWIYDKYFVKVNRANERYLEFGNDIRFLATQLEQLNNVCGKANDQLRDRNVRSVKDLEFERQELLGDFQKTLRQSHQLLESNAKYASNGFIDTMRFYTTGIEAQAMLLRDRLQFHCAKIGVILKPLELEMLSKIDQKISILQRQGRDQIRLLRSIKAQEQAKQDQVPRVDQFGLLEVPHELSERYENQAYGSRPFENSEAFPFKETLNALLYHFKDSTVHARAGYFSLDQYNSLIKTRWLLGKILESARYRQMGPCLSRSVIEDVEEEVHQQYSRFEEDWDIVQGQSITKLGDEHFKIWIVEEVAPLALVVTDEGAGEVKILELGLPEPQGISKQSLLVFRQSDTEHRLLRTSLLEGANLEIPSEKQIVNVHFFRFVPFYAVPNAVEPANSVWICHSKVHQGDIFDMRTREDAFAFQRALTGYEVTYTSKVRWELQRDGFMKKGLKGKGWSGLQIWEWNPLSRVGASAEEVQSPNGTLHSRRSNSDTHSPTVAQLATRFPEHAASIITSPNGATTQDIIASTTPKIPVLILFSFVNGKLSFLQVPLEQGMGINFERCGCLAKNSTCCTSVLENNPGKKGKFKMKMHSVPNDTNGSPVLADWDLLIFGQPRHPKFEALETLNDVTWLDFELPTSDDRKRFQIAFLQSMKRFREKREDFNRVRATFAALDHRPNSGKKHRSSSAGLHPPLNNPRPHSRTDISRRTSTMTSNSVISTSSDEYGSNVPLPNSPQRASPASMPGNIPTAYIQAQQEPPSQPNITPQRRDSAREPSPLGLSRRASTMTYVASPTHEQQMFSLPRPISTPTPTPFPAREHRPSRHDAAYITQPTVVEQDEDEPDLMQDLKAQLRNFDLGGGANGFASVREESKVIYGVNVAEKAGGQGLGLKVKTKTEEGKFQGTSFGYLPLI